jgi:hypothetical protein
MFLDYVLGSALSQNLQTVVPHGESRAEPRRGAERSWSGCAMRLVSPDDLEFGCERGERCWIGDRREVDGIMGGNLTFDLGRVRLRTVILTL